MPQQTKKVSKMDEKIKKNNSVEEITSKLSLLQAVKTFDKSLQDSMKRIEENIHYDSLPVAGGDIKRQVIKQRGLTKKMADIERQDKNGKDKKVDIFIRVVFLKLGEIDTANEQFSADVFIQARWREPALDGDSKNEEFEVINKSEIWDPKLYVENALGELKESIWYVVSYDFQGLATIYQRRRVKGTFFERMELNQFPFDTQDLTITMSTERGEFELDLHEDVEQISTVNIQSFISEQEWNLHRHINSWKKQTTSAYKSSRHKHPAVSISCKATRRPKFFIWNIILVMIFICSLVFTTFTVSQDLPQNRLQLAFILLLSNITFKFTVNAALPKVSYLTYLDKYILISMAIQCLVCVWHAIVSRIHYKTVENNHTNVNHMGVDYSTINIDSAAFLTLVSVYFIFNLIFFLWCRHLVKKRSRDYNRRDLKQKELLKKMEMLHQAPRPSTDGFIAQNNCELTI